MTNSASASLRVWKSLRWATISATPSTLSVGSCLRGAAGYAGSISKLEILSFEASRSVKSCLGSVGAGL